MKRSLTGIRPSGNPHLGNYLGAIKPALALQEKFECFYFLADMHTLTTLKNAKEMRSRNYDMAATWLALGFDAQRHSLYRQSDLPETAELAWYLSCCTGMGFLEKAHAYKDSAAQNKDVNHGVFAYPVLMAADILLYDADLVPVGKDQKQHVEMARDMAGSFNAIFGIETLKLPEPLVAEEVMSIPGLDGRKMSKSYKNEIPIFASQAELKKLVMSIKTDSTALDAPKELSSSLVGELFALFGSSEQKADLSKRLQAGGLGWGHAKVELFELLDAIFSEKRKIYESLRVDEAMLDSVLAHGAEKARAVGSKVLSRVREAIGFKERAF